VEAEDWEYHKEEEEVLSVERLVFQLVVHDEDFVLALGLVSLREGPEKCSSQGREAIVIVEEK
jgi:hypothetical protein